MSLPTMEHVGVGQTPLAGQEIDEVVVMYPISQVTVTVLPQVLAPVSKAAFPFGKVGSVDVQSTIKVVVYKLSKIWQPMQNYVCLVMTMRYILRKTRFYGLFYKLRAMNTKYLFIKAYMKPVIDIRMIKFYENHNGNIEL